MLTLDECATVLNALRYYCEHNNPHEHERALIEKIRPHESFLKSVKSGTITVSGTFEHYNDWEKHGLPAILEK